MNPKFTLFSFLLFFIIGYYSNAQVVVDILAPESIQGRIQAAYAEFGPTISSAPTFGELVYLDGTDEFGCNEISQDLTGKIAIIDRGTCDYSIKALNAQNAGATALIIALEAGRTLTFVVSAGDMADQVTIPVVALLDTDYNVILQALEMDAVSGSIYNYDELAMDNIVYSESFDNGLNGWTPSNSEEPDSTWSWEPNGESKAVVFYVNSPTAQENGAAVFDASWYNQDFLGQPLPYPFYTASLTSPAIDVSDHEYLYLTFYQANWQLNQRNFPIPQTYLEYSLDDGNQWSPRIEVQTDNDLINQNSNYPHTELISILLEDLQFSENLRLRFTYDGDFYFWGIDDIRLIVPPDDELAIESSFYPLIHYATPFQHITTDVMGFQAQVFNGGVNDQLNNEVKIQVVNEDMTVFYEQMRIIPLDAFARDTIVFDNWAAVLDPGNYFLKYTFENENIIDAFPENNVKSYPFVITEQTFAQELAEQEDILQSFRNSAQPYYFGSTFTVSNAAIQPCEFLGTDIAINAQDGSLDDESFTLYLFKWTDDNDGYPDYSNELNINNTSPIDHPNFEIVAIRLVVGNGLAQNELFSLNLSDGEWLDETATPIDELILDAGTYAVVGEFDGAAVGFAGFNGENLAGVPTILYNAGGGMTWSPGIVDNFFPIIRSHVDCIVGTSSKELSDASVEVFPTLANDKVEIAFDLDDKSDVTIAILSMQGKILAFRNLADVKSANEIIETTRFPAGNYIIDIQTTQGIKQQKITVMH